MTKFSLQERCSFMYKKLFFIILALFLISLTLNIVNLKDFFSGARKKELEISYKDAKVKLKSINDEKSLLEHFKNLIENEDIFNLLLDFLRREKNVYNATDRQLVEYLSELCHDDENYIKFSNCLNEYEILRTLRGRAEKRQSPFQYEAIKVDIGFPHPEPNEGKVFACKNSPFQGHRIEILSKNLARRIEREVAGYYTCTRKPYPDIQLSQKDGQELFGNIDTPYKSGYAIKLD